MGKSMGKVTKVTIFPESNARQRKYKPPKPYKVYKVLTFERTLNVRFVNVVHLGNVWGRIG